MVSSPFLIRPTSAREKATRQLAPIISEAGMCQANFTRLVGERPILSSRLSARASVSWLTLGFRTNGSRLFGNINNRSRHLDFLAPLCRLRMRARPYRLR